MQRFLNALGLMFFLVSFSVCADPRVLESGTRQSTLVELYTSEGCSSCPPAEHFLNGFTRHPDLWTRYIPMAFHVDYWDDLGWKDRFSKAQYSQRQRKYARVQRQNTVYTPAFLVNGEPWRPMFYTRDIEAAHVQVGRLRLLIDAGHAEATFTPVEPPIEAELNIALLGMGIETRIEAGERSGSRARHEFVVLGHRRYAPQDNHWQVELAFSDDHRVDRLAVVAWVSRPGNPAPVQSVGGELSPAQAGEILR